MGPEYKFASLGFKSKASTNKIGNSVFDILMHGYPYSEGLRPVHTVLDFFVFVTFCFPYFLIFLKFSSIYSMLLAVYSSVVSIIRVLLQFLLCALWVIELICHDV